MIIIREREVQHSQHALDSDNKSDRSSQQSHISRIDDEAGQVSDSQCSYQPKNPLAHDLEMKQESAQSNSSDESDTSSKDENSLVLNVKQGFVLS